MKVAREQSVLIIAPAFGWVTKIIDHHTILKQGDTICVLWSETEQPKSEPKPVALPPQQPSSSPERVPEFRQRSGMSPKSIMESLEESTQLEKRLLEITAQLQKGDQEPTPTAKLNRDLSAVKLQVETSLTILKGQLETSNRPRL